MRILKIIKNTLLKSRTKAAAVIVLIIALVFASSVPIKVDAKKLTDYEVNSCFYSTQHYIVTMTDYFKGISKILNKPLSKYGNKKYSQIKAYEKLYENTFEVITNYINYDYSKIKNTTKSTKKFFKYFNKCLKWSDGMLEKMEGMKIKTTRNQAIKMSYLYAIYCHQLYTLAYNICNEYETSKKNSNQNIAKSYQNKAKEHSKISKMLLKEYKKKKYNKVKKVIVIDDPYN